jgi:hypothetical protein
MAVVRQFSLAFGLNGNNKGTIAARNVNFNLKTDYKHKYALQSRL